MMSQETIKVPPDGKWGWMIVLAYAINGMTTVSLMQGFVLIFKDIFPLYGFTATQGAIILNTNLAFGMILGLINGPLLRTFGYRKMAVAGSIFYAFGVIMTAFSKSFVLLIIFYGIFASLGICITLSAFSYALNSYFTTKRGRAMSLAMTIIGLGPILIPQVTTFLTSVYGFQGTILLYGAFSLHSLVGSMLLHPLKWHTKQVKNETKTENEESLTKEDNKTLDEKNSNFQDDKNLINSSLDVSNVQNRRKITISSIDHDAEIGSIYGYDIPYARQLSESISVMNIDLPSSWDNDIDMHRVAENGQRSRKFANIFKSIDTINLGSSIKIFDEKPGFLARYNSFNVCNESDRHFQSVMENDSLLQKNESNIESNTKNGYTEKSEKKLATTRACKKIAQWFDLDLLRDPIYVNIMFGMAIAIFAEINFSQLTPFILMDMNLSTKQIATIMSLVASVDLIFRSLAPFIGEWLRQPPRIMYQLSLCLLIISRTSLLFANGFVSLLFIAVGLGVAKGIRSVYMSLVIPHYVPIDRLANASGIQMIVNGLILLSAGPLLGVIRDSVGSYKPCIIIMNLITAVTVIIWSLEMYVVRRRKLRMNRQHEDNS